jgi:hypothetical protein
MARAWTRSNPGSLGRALHGEQHPSQLIVVEADHRGAEAELCTARGRWSRGRVVFGRIDQPPAADVVLLLEDEGCAARGGEELRRGQPGGAGAHHGDIRGDPLRRPGRGGADSGSSPSPAR